MDDKEQSNDIPGAVAIVGMAGRWPGADSVDEFWRNLIGGVESITHFTDAELEDSFAAEERSAANFVKARPIIKDVDQFDSEFFGMYAKEAELTDPQHRLFLECCWQALEDAGYDPAAYRGAIGVFAGCSINTYFLNNVLGQRKTTEDFVSNYQVGQYPMLLGAGHDFLSTRVSYKLDLRGPSVTMSTACSTSLLAVAQACQSLLLYQSDMALAGGVSITFPQKRGYQHLEGGMVSADGSCRPFDADATGTIFGDGVATVLLKRLDDAIADGDHVYAIVRGSGINNDGASKVGFTAPSVTGQAAVIEMAHAGAGVDARSISYVECHGTATPLGDPIEITGLTTAFAAGTADLQFCALGSVKGNVGHLDAAAGITGLIKTALALHHGMLPASLHYQRANPQINFAKTPFFVNATLTPWPKTTAPRRAGVSAFGVGGTNVHVVLEEAPGVAAPGGIEACASQLLVLSARSATALDASRLLLATHLREHPARLQDVAYTLQAGRRAFGHRMSMVATSVADACALLEAKSIDMRVGPAHLKTGEVVFMFPGQGAQYPNMGRDLFESESVFRTSIERCARVLKPLMDDDLLTLLYPTEPSPDASERLMMTVAAQPAIFSVEYSLATLWMSWGIKPAAMIGHSVGEFVAAVIAGVLSLEDALAIVAARGRLMQALPGGCMLAVRLPEAEVAPLLTDALNLAAVNGPSLCVVAGPYATIDDIEASLATRNIVTRRLHTSHAFHSAMVDPVIEPLRELLQRIPLSAPQIPYVSCVSGDWISPEQATSPDYWARHAREPVRFADGIVRVSTSAATILIEVGPGAALSTLATQATRGRNIPVVTCMPDAARQRNDRDCLLEALGRAWSHGAAPDWSALHAGPHARISLPTYPFERKRHWIAAPQIDAASLPHLAPLALPVMEPIKFAIQDESAMTQNPTSDRTAAANSALAAIFEELSGDKPAAADAHTPFLEMGYDSLFLTQVAQKIQSQMKVKITFRQLLGEFSTIAALAGFLADKIPVNAKAMPAPVVVATQQTTPLSAAPTLPALPLAPAGQAGVESFFRDQLQAMSQLMNRQFEVLQSLGGLPASAAPALSLPVASVPDTQADAQPSRFAVFMQGKSGIDNNVTPAQRRHIDALVAVYTQKTQGSKAFTQSHRGALADPRAAAGFRTEWKEMVYPIVNTTSAGSKIHDIDGNEYVDVLNGFGQTAFGHAPPFVVAAVKAQLDRGFAIGPQADMAGKVAELFCELTGNQRMTFCNTGSEAVMAAMRLARTVTGREKIVVFNGDYHGQFDEVLVKGVQRSGAEPRSQPVAPGIPSSQVENMIVLEYGSPQALRWIRDNADDLAAVIVEPVQSRHPHTQPFEFLREVRKITAASGTAFVMDEVVTGFRVHAGGMQAVLGIRADLAAYGKVVGGGMPVGVLAGTHQFMDALDGGQWAFGDDSFPEVGVTFFAGTFVRHPLVLASMWSVLNHLKDSGPSLLENLSNKTASLVSRLTNLFERRGVATKIESYSSWFYFNFHNEHPLAPLFYYHMRERGIHIQESFPCFLTTAHSDQDCEKIYRAFESSLDALQAVGILGDGSPAAERAVAHAASQPTGSLVRESAMNADVPLTESQLEIWLSAQLGDDASCAFNESVTLTMLGRLNRDALQKSLDCIVERHDALRATFSSTGEAMHISATKPFDYPFIDLSNRSPLEADIALAELLDADARTVFDLVAGPCVRGTLVRLAGDSHAFILTAHHIICDGWSVNVMVNELAEIYGASCRGENANLPDALHFSEFARTQANRDAVELAKTEAFWLQEFSIPTAALQLPTDRARPTLKSFNGASLCRRIDAKLYQAVKKAGARQGSTLFVTLLSAYQVLMGRLADQSEVVVGVPTAGQSLLEDQILVGHCVNFLPIRGSWTRDTKISDYLSANIKRVLDAYEHQNYTFGTLVRKLNLPRDPSRLPVAEVQFNLESLTGRIDLPGLTMTVSPNAKAFVNFDLFLNVIESADGLRLDCDYNTDLFDASTVAHWLDCYQALLESIVADVTQPLSSASCLPSGERAELIDRLNDTAAEYPRAHSVHALIEAHVKATPHAMAAQFGDTSISYEALDARANQLANVLRERIGGATGKLVGVSVERSLDMLVALIAVMKIGCAYVPLDPQHPAARLRYILAEAEVAALVCDDSASASWVATGTTILDVRRDAAAIAAASAVAPALKVAADSLAYVIYTSGSTGKPKGVEISHRAVVNLLTSMARIPGLSADDVLYAVTTISFDIAGLELFLPLSVGGKVVIAESNAVIDGFRLLKSLQTVGATVMQATPASWRLLLEAGFKAPSAFKMLCGGEVLPRELANRLLEGSGELWNMYGPTETTIWSSCTRVTAGAAAITVGGPIANTQFYVLDHNDQPVPRGIPGQLHIGGDGVARGYYKRPALTQEKFVSSPFSDGRLYRTGDLARWLTDGSLQIMGRIDHQVKLRGYRIELGEIETVLATKGNLGAVAVILRGETPEAARLVAYYVEKVGESRSPAALRVLLAEDMPDYMIPSDWVRLEALPLSPNGKLDRAALPLPNVMQPINEEFVEPKTATEGALTKIFGEVLNLQVVGATSDLLKMGADSIQLFQITARANRAGIKLTARQLLQHRNAVALGAAVDLHSDAPATVDPSSSLPSLGQFKRNRRAS